MMIRRLTPDDVAAFQSLRLSALLEQPSAFGASYSEEQAFPLEVLQARLAVHPDRGVFGAYDQDRLIGLVALGRESMLKLRHKGMIFGMYVVPDFRHRGVGRALILAAQQLARSVPDLKQVNLCVNANNQAAIALYESVGFRTFGRELNALCIDNQFFDELHMYWDIQR